MVGTFYHFLQQDGSSCKLFLERLDFSLQAYLELCAYFLFIAFCFSSWHQWFWNPDFIIFWFLKPGLKSSCSFKTEKENFWFTLVNRSNMLFTRVIIVLFLIKTCIGWGGRITGGKTVSLSKKGKLHCTSLWEKVY